MDGNDHHRVDKLATSAGWTCCSAASCDSDAIVYSTAPDPRGPLFEILATGRTVFDRSECSEKSRPASSEEERWTEPAFVNATLDVESSASHEDVTQSASMPLLSSQTQSRRTGDAMSLAASLSSSTVSSNEPYGPTPMLAATLTLRPQVMGDHHSSYLINEAADLADEATQHACKPLVALPSPVYHHRQTHRSKKMVRKLAKRVRSMLLLDKISRTSSERMEEVRFDKQTISETSTGALVDQNAKQSDQVKVSTASSRGTNLIEFRSQTRNSLDLQQQANISATIAAGPRRGRTRRRSIPVTASIDSQQIPIRTGYGLVRMRRSSTPQRLAPFTSTRALGQRRTSTRSVDV